MLTRKANRTVSRSISVIRVGVLAGLLLMSLCFKGQSCAQTLTAPGAAMKEIRFVVLHDIYSETAPQDARMALELIMQKTIARKSYPYVVTFDLLDKTNDIAAAIQKGGYHFVTLSGVDFFSYRDALDLTPVLIPSKSDLPTETLLLLVNKGQTLTTIGRKPQRKLILEKGRRGDLSRIWLDKILARSNLPESERFFTHTRHVKKPSRAVLPVFFNQADACVITRNALDVIQELNPQIAQRIEALFFSKGVVRRLICATPRTDPLDVDVFVRESVQIDHNADTQQAMTIIQMKRFHRVNAEGLEATRILMGNAP